MIQPVILVVDPQPEVLGAIKDDLQRKYNENFQVLRANSGTAAIEKLKQLREQNNSITLFVVEQQDSQMAGMEFLKLVMKKFPKAKQLLLKTYETDEAPCQLPLLNAVVV